MRVFFWLTSSLRMFSPKVTTSNITLVQSQKTSHADCMLLKRPRYSHSPLGNGEITGEDIVRLYPLNSGATNE